MKSEIIQIKKPRLEKPVRITEHVWPEGVMPVVSICCITYQHVNFLRDAIDGFLMQETTFPAEIIIRDDASTDGTAEVVKEYVEKYPQLIRTILHAENQYSKGKRAFPETFAVVRGEFIALCEGDDFWDDHKKLEIQVDFLEKNPDFSCCFHRTSLVDENSATIQEDYFIPDGSEFDFRDCLVKLKKKYATCSMLFRKHALDNPRSWFLKSPQDMFLELQLASNGKIGFIDRNMGAYRKHAGGVWMGISGVQKNLVLLYRYQLLLDDPEIRESHGGEISQMIKKLERGFCLKTECAEILCKQSLFYRIAWFIDTSFNFIFRNAQNFKRSIFGFSKS
jgi:glycosyltransferase involved in cell wall biosynthesis